MSIRLRPRLQAVADMINNAKCVADVGCDHGRLSAALIEQGRAARVTASDVSALSLQKARQLIAKCGLGQRVETVVANGLCAVSPGSADVIVFAGMGGELIASLMEASLLTAKSADLIVMQPMRGVEELRRFLAANGFGIYDETLVADAGRIYQVIAAKSGLSCTAPPWFPENEYSVGPQMFAKHDPLLVRLLCEYRDGHLKRLAKAKQKGVSPAPLNGIIERAEVLIKLAMEMQNEA